jgi:hypothetical protein
MEARAGVNLLLDAGGLKGKGRDEAERGKGDGS